MSRDEAVTGRASRTRHAAGALLLALALLGAAWVSPAAGQPHLLLGITDDAFLGHPGTTVAAARDLGLGGFRVSLPWSAGQTRMSATDIASFDRMVALAGGLRIVVTVYGRAVDAPTDGPGRDAYCTYVRDLLSRYPAINDVVIWNEANLGFFWQPQYNPDGTSAAPTAYETLLARCWDVLHSARPGVNLIMSTSPSGNDNPRAVSNVSHSPGSFVRGMGSAYRASGRTQPIFDTVGHNPYGMSSAEAPWAQHLTPGHIGEGDLDRLVQALDDGFGGTGQPVPGYCPRSGATGSCVSVWYLEAGYQSVPDAEHQADYTGRENDDRPLSDAGADGPTQATQLRAGIELAYCQPYVGAFFNFLLVDEPDLARWQSGVLWSDGNAKPSYGALKSVVGEAAAGSVNCNRLRSSAPGALQPSAGALVERIEWPSLTALSRFNEVWSFAIDARTNATYRAAIVRAGRETATRGTPRIATAGSLVRERPRIVTFPATTLRPGRYRMQITVTRTAGSRLSVTRTSSAFVVG